MCGGGVWCVMVVVVVVVCGGGKQRSHKPLATKESSSP